MSLSLPVIREIAPPKPARGSACNGCGVCCAAEVCAIGMAVMPDAQTPCPAMEFEHGRFWCGLVRNLPKYAPMSNDVGRIVSETFSRMLGINMGCDSDDPTASKARQA